MKQALLHAIRRRAPLAQSCALSLLVLASGVYADDTEVFFGQVDLTEDNRPNLLFVLDTSGSMTTPNLAGETRIDRLKEAMHKILDGSSNVNVGLMRFNGAAGGGSVVFPITSVDGVVCKHAFCDIYEAKSAVEDMADDAEQNASSGTMSLDGNVLTMGYDGLTQQYVGLSFKELDIPQGARIVSAHVEFTAERDDDIATDLEISVEATDDATPYIDTLRDIENRSTTTAIDWSPEPWVLNSRYDSPDLSTIVQEVTDRAGWCAENTLNIVIEGTGSRSAKSQRRDLAAAPKLKVVYDGTAIPVGGGCVRETRTVTVNQNSDDSMEVTPGSASLVGNNYWWLNSLRLPRYSNAYRSTSALRFRDLGVPADAVVEEAYLTLKSTRIGGSSSSPIKVRLKAQASDNASTFTSSNWNISSRATVGDVDWEVPVTANGDNAVSPDITSLVQAVVSRPGWDSDNAMALLIEAVNADNGMHEFGVHESGKPASLTVKYRSAIDASVNRTVKDELKLAVDSLTPTGGTPVAGALFEASQYLRGEAVDYGKTRGYKGKIWYDYSTAMISAPDRQPFGNWNLIGPYDWRSSRHRLSHPASYTGGTHDTNGCPSYNSENPDCARESLTGNPIYQSPMLESCQTNHVVLLSDGEPTGNAAGRRIESVIGGGCFGAKPDAAEQCGQELAQWMYETDFNSQVGGVQGIRTYTVGFDLAGQPDATAFLKGISTAGGGKHFPASSTDDLVRTFQEIIGAVTTVDTAFVSPGATVNQFNRLTHRDDIYFALFKPSDRMRWEGNLKRYKADDDGDDIVIRDVNSDPAVDTEAGFFADTAQSFWSDAADGSNVSLGGFSGELELVRSNDNEPRRVFTYTGSTPVTSAVDLTLDANKLDKTNSDITAAMLGITGHADSVAYRDTLLDWGRGVDIDDVDGDGVFSEIRHEIGDPMHSQPVILNYGDTPESNKTTVFVATNQGFLHALDPDINAGGAPTDIEARELFSFIPQELLDNLAPYYENKVTQTHTYGLDGLMSIYIDDKDNDLIVDSDEKAFLFVGMRRGGSNYYAIDVSDRENPKLAWSIKGGAGGSAGFERLGQTWSRMVPTKVQKDGVVHKAVIFTGGYSTNQDARRPESDPTSPRYGLVPSRTKDDEGDGLYIVSMTDGSLIWSGLRTGGTEDYASMEYSMPASPKVLDVDFDGAADQIYLSDTGGQVWRFDIAPFHDAGDSRPFMSGGVMARLGDDSIDDKQRRFYYQPDVSLIEKDGKRFTSISLGSGWRAHPLNKKIKDRFYVLRSDATDSIPEGYGRFDGDLNKWVPITDADLANADDLTLDIDVDGHGWYKELGGVGEKALARSLTINNQVTFTTYLPQTKVALCSPAIGSGAVYLLDVVSGRPTADLNDDGVIDANDDKRLLKHPGLPPPVVAIITKKNESTLIGTEQNDDVDFGQGARRTFWADLSDQPTEADLENLMPAAAEPTPTQQNPNTP